MCNPQSDTGGVFVVICGHVLTQSSETFECTLLAEVNQGKALPPCLSSPTVAKVLSAVYLVPRF